MSETNFHPKNPRQIEYAEAIQDNYVTFGLGPAGTGKTYVALAQAVQMLHNKDVDSIIVVRPNVSSGDKSLGFFPGTKQEKIAEWMKPAINALKRLLGKQQFQVLYESDVIQLEPLETMRGETFDRSFVLLDEAQNVIIEDLEMFLTRIGEHSTFVIDGDVEQTDLSNRSGLASVIEMVRNYPNVEYPVVEFDIEDVVRSPVCKDFIKMFRAARRQEAQLKGNP